MRVYLYILAGIASALIGWNLGQFLLDASVFQQNPEVVLFPCVAISLAVGIVMHEIFISNPTRPKLNFRIVRLPILIAAGLGLLIGSVAGGISQILFLPQIPIPAPIVRMLGWIAIGSSVGLAEGLTWRWHSQEAGDRLRSRQRFRLGLLAASGASVVAAVLFELLRLGLGQMPEALKGIEDPIGFSILGLFLGLTFSITNSPSYMAALRAGSGFEHTEWEYDDIGSDNTSNNHRVPQIDRDLLAFVSDSAAKDIEEGLSIRLPTTGKIAIGSEPTATIYIPGIPSHVADLEVRSRETVLHPDPDCFKAIEINGEPLAARKPILLKHNYLLTFHTLEEDGVYEPKIYRFVYYNRFLDPQA